MTRIYLDNCCFNRPYDNQKNPIVKLEAESKLYIQTLIKEKKLELVWSYILETENDDNPYQERRETIEEWKSIAIMDLVETNEILDQAENFMKLNLRPKDSLHLACAVFAKANYFITVDKDFINRANRISSIKIVSPIGFIDILEELL